MKLLKQIRTEGLKQEDPDCDRNQMDIDLYSEEVFKDFCSFNL